MCAVCVMRQRQRSDFCRILDDVGLQVKIHEILLYISPVVLSRIIIREKRVGSVSVKAYYTNYTIEDI